MMRISTLGLCSAIIGALVCIRSPAVAQTPPSKTPDSTMQTPHPTPSQTPSMMSMSDSTSAAAGEALFKKKGCPACHNIAKAGGDPHRPPGGKGSGPDLAGVTQRRTEGWLRQWLKDPKTMQATDSTAIAMVIHAKNLKMPDFKLTDTEVEALVNFLKTKTS